MRLLEPSKKEQSALLAWSIAALISVLVMIPRGAFF